MNDVLVIGAGAIGCSLAYHLAQQDLKVLVLDPAGPAGEASSVAAGILANLDAIGRRDPAATIGLESLRLFPTLTERLKKETGIETYYRKTGYILLKSEPAGWSLPLLQRAQAAGLRVERIAPNRLHTLEPALRTNAAEALFEPDAATIHSRSYTLALAAACRKLGVRFIEDRVLSSHPSRGRIVAVRTRTEKFSAGSFALCAGAWSGLLGKALGLPIPVIPARGQLLLLKSQPGLLNHVIELGAHYLSPWEKEKVLAGTTVERVGFRRGVTQSAMTDLRRFAAGMLPPMAKARALVRLSSFRPEPPDGLPLLGKAPGFDNLWIATGHFRQGIILSPWTGKNVARWIYEGKEDAGLEAFSPARFKSSDTAEMEAIASAPAART